MARLLYETGVQILRSARTQINLVFPYMLYPRCTKAVDFGRLPVRHTVGSSTPVNRGANISLVTRSQTSLELYLEEHQRRR